MNFKKYHVSRNLWNNGDTWTNTSTDTRTFFQPDIALFDGNTKVGDNARIDVKSNGYKYLVSITPSTSFTRVSVKHNGFTKDLPLGSVYGEFEANVPVTVSFVVNGYDPTAIGGISISNIMLNTGSTALPYEPYSSEVWHDTPHYIHKTDTDTITTPAVLYPTGTTATVGLKGNTVQSTTPTPQNPIQPQECGERTGNLFDADSYYASYKSGNSYTATTSQFNTAIISPFTTSDIGKTYTISCDITEISSTNVRWLATINGVSVNGDGRSSTGQIKLTFTVATANDSLKITYGSGNYTLTIANVMMNEGSAPIPYEPYGYKIPILSAITTTPVYLSEMQSTRRIKKLVLTGAESWGRSGTTGVLYTLLSDSYYKGNIITLLCSHYPSQINVANNNQIEEGKACILNSNHLSIRDNNFASYNDFKTYLQQQYAAGTPVCVWYVLAEPTTGIVNEPLRKIGIYADEVSGITIPTIAGANTLSVDTTLQPSEVSINYKGWHPVADVHEAENGQWD